MERFPENGEYYKFHSGAMDPVLYEEACSILINAVAGGRDGNAADVLPSDRPEFDALTPRARTESMLTLWERMLCDAMASDERVVALDGDLSFDTGTHLARHRFPERYIQSGIAEQDMVSMAGTLALSGHIPFVHSFSTFLTMRATEQIFNNATEYSQIIYMGFLSGLVPSAPGFSHQAVTDVGIMSSIPGMRVFEPACETELRWVVGQALEHKGPSFIRMGGLAPLSPAESEASSVERISGIEVALVSSGPLLAHQAIEAKDLLLDKHGVRAGLFSAAEITGNSLEKLAKELESYRTVVVLENHNPALAKYEVLKNLLGAKPAVRVSRLGLDGVPANGQPQEVLRYHGFDAVSIAGSVVDVMGQ